MTVRQFLPIISYIFQIKVYTVSRIGFVSMHFARFFSDWEKIIQLNPLKFFPRIFYFFASDLPLFQENDAFLNVHFGVH